MVILAGILFAAAVEARADPPAGPVSDPPHAILFDQPGFHGRFITIVRSSPDLNFQQFAGRALSVRLDGDWELCDAPGYGGRCQVVRGDLSDLSKLGLAGNLVSLRQTGGQPVAGQEPVAVGGAAEPETDANDGYFDRAPVRERPVPRPPPPPASMPPPPLEIERQQGALGYGSVFFAHPERAGADIPGQGRDLADDFCRGQNLGPALYYDTDGRALRDVLCRRR